MLDQPQGTLAAGSQQEVVARFRAVDPAHYWKRLSCDVLVRSPFPYGPALSIELLSLRPPTMLHRSTKLVVLYVLFYNVFTCASGSCSMSRFLKGTDLLIM